MPKGICIASKKDGFRRCGIAHPAEPTTYPAKDFDKEQLACLMDEPMLVVTEVDIPDPEKANKKKK